VSPAFILFTVKLGSISLLARSVFLSRLVQCHWHITGQCVERDFPRERDTWSRSIRNEISLYGWIFPCSIDIRHWAWYRLLYPVLPEDEIQRRICSIVSLRPGEAATPNSAGCYSFVCDRKTTNGFRWSSVNPSWKKIDMHVFLSPSILYRAPLPMSQVSSCSRYICYLIVDGTSDIKPPRILDTSVLDEIRILVPARSSSTSAFIWPVYVRKLFMSPFAEDWLIADSSAQICGSLMLFERSSRPVLRVWVWAWFGK